ncbi:Hypp3723 [Branchiostoma lanceolatum]|uniref:Hypp3723 protein n=1 Tax=Branchiostoma lanceolatum TaxID=7740 RepID=A0A8K0A1M8_BRALA|nr:Hypp3723 [Branchiostoma lanceolatum]
MGMRRCLVLFVVLLLVVNTSGWWRRRRRRTNCGTCSSPPPSISGTTMYNCAPPYVPGTICKYRCNKGTWSLFRSRYRCTNQCTWLGTTTNCKASIWGR